MNAVMPMSTVAEIDPSEQCLSGALCMSPE
ncbi:hypothetical protein GGD71_005348 [Variovorax guangxiensis]|uniref:Uncharacterized protein n=1 Tax=Variovorax guangxiensis TaxID=1775474 RepID=A0A840FUR0_9BURK|nr:hypothetical protein [Variovorax guangxiensis]